MGLIGSLLKGVGKIAKAGASVLTHGVSDKVLTIAKGLGKKSTAIALKPADATAQYEASVNKAAQGTGVRKAAATASARAGLGQVGTYAKGGKLSPAMQRAMKYGAPKLSATKTTYAPAVLKRAKKSPRGNPAGMRGTGKRVPPPGGLDLAAMALAWRAASKPVSWAQWIKTQQIRRK